MQHIPIEKEELPIQFVIDFGEDSYVMKFSYNAVGDFFTASISKETDEEELRDIVLGEKMVINKPLFSDFTESDLPLPALIPMDLSQLETRISWDNFGETVFLYVQDDEGPFGDDVNGDN